MAEQMYINENSDRTTSPWAAGFALFAGIMLIIIGCYQAIIGFAALLKNEFFVVTDQYAYKFDVSGWGWIHLLIGIVMVAAGFGVIVGQLWARIIGIILAVLSAIANFFFIPYYPLWSIAIIALDVFVIWALCVHGRREKTEVEMTETA